VQTEPRVGLAYLREILARFLKFEYRNNNKQGRQYSYKVILWRDRITIFVVGGKDSAFCVSIVELDVTVNYIKILIVEKVLL
jgi:hypothetical protein